MKRAILLLATPVLLSAASPLALAEREAALAGAEQRRLEREAANALGAAAQARARAGAAAQALIAAEARIAASEAGLVQLGRQQEQAARRLAEAQRPLTALMAGLVQLDRRPIWVALAAAGAADEQVRLAVLVRTLRPAIEQRTAALRGDLAALRHYEKRQQAMLAGLAGQRQAAAAARTAFLAAERTALGAAEARGLDAFAAEDRVLDRAERAAGLRSEGEQRRAATRLAAELMALPPAFPRPAGGGDLGPAPAPPFAWIVPAGGPVTVGAGELLRNGVRARGLTIAAARGTQVVAPAAGRIVFAGPFRRREGIVIIDHGKGWATLLSEVRGNLAVGALVAAGAPVGRALGPVTAELFQGGTPHPAALIARSS